MEQYIAIAKHLLLRYLTNNWRLCFLIYFYLLFERVYLHIIEFLRLIETFKNILMNTIQVNHLDPFPLVLLHVSLVLWWRMPLGFTWDRVEPQNKTKNIIHNLFFPPFLNNYCWILPKGQSSSKRITSPSLVLTCSSGSLENASGDYMGQSRTPKKDKKHQPQPFFSPSSTIIVGSFPKNNIQVN